MFVYGDADRLPTGHVLGCNWPYAPNLDADDGDDGFVGPWPPSAAPTAPPAASAAPTAPTTAAPTTAAPTGAGAGDPDRPEYQWRAFEVARARRTRRVGDEAQAPPLSLSQVVRETNELAFELLVYANASDADEMRDQGLSGWLAYSVERWYPAPRRRGRRG